LDARRAYAAGLAGLRTQSPETLALARIAAKADPSFVAAHQLEAWLLLCSRDARDFRSVGEVLERLDGLPMTAQELMHAEAIAATAGGDYARGARLIDGIVEEYPRDLVALVAGQVFDYFIGDLAALLRRTALALPRWSSADPGYHAMLSLHAFALEESGSYEEAERAAHRALALEPHDVRAHHVVTHVLEMQGRAEEGIRWMGARTAFWSGAGAASTHLWWHLALHQLELGRVRLALEVYDRRMQGRGLSERIDASALLWRMHLAGHDVGARFAPLAEAWAPYAEDAHCAFNDIHAMMAFAGAGHWQDAARLLAAQERRVALRGGANYDMTRLVGLPASRALAAYGRGDYAAAETVLRALPPVAHRIGGSHAQRDILQLTRAASIQRRPKKAA
jgi:hypothetical protein